MSGPMAPVGRDWVAEYFAEVDRMDPDGLLRWYAEDGNFRFANEPRVEGKPAIREILRTFYDSIPAMRHRMTGVWVDEIARSGVWEAEVDFVTRDGRAVVIPAVSTIRLKEGRVHDFRFVNAGPLRAEGAPR